MTVRFFDKTKASLISSYIFQVQVFNFLLYQHQFKHMVHDNNNRILLQYLNADVN